MSLMGPIGEPKPLASLTSSLLARKGGAKPAMRRQLLDLHDHHDHNQFGHGAHALEDLGWNDMGHDTPNGTLPVAALTPMPGGYSPAPIAPQMVAAAPVVEAAEEPLVLEVAAPQVTATEQLSAPVMAEAPAPLAPEPVATVKAAPLPSRAANGASGKSRSAFTLRVDAERHLKLRLACAVSHRSAQQIVTQALDEYLGNLPDIAKLAGQVPTHRHT